MRTRSSLEYTIPRRRNCRRSRHRQEAIPLNLDPIPMADNRTMAQMLQAPIEGYEDAIVTSTFRHPEVPNTSVKLFLFPFSLDDEARDWFSQEPPRSILTWDDLVSKFINQYFPPSKTTYYRNEIITFYQKPNEAFNEAWERFKGLLRQCPHHGFSELHQLDTFYNSLNSNDQDALDSAAGGNFLDKMPQEGLAIIESKSKVRYSRSRANDSRVSTDAPLSNSSSSNNSFEMQQIAASLEDKMTIKMNQMMNQMKALVVTTPAPSISSWRKSCCTTCLVNNHSFNVCPMTRGGYEYPVYHDNFQQFQQTASVGNFVQNGNSGYRAPNLANQMRPPGFNQPNPQASRPNQGYNANQGYNGNRNVNQTSQVNHGANSGLSQQAQAYQVPSTPAPDGLERIVFKPDGSQDNESIHMMDVYDDRVKDVCEPESNDDSTTSAIVDEFESLLGDIIKQKEELKGISDPVARRKACFLDKFKITNQGRVIHSPKKATISAISHIFPNNNFEDSFTMGNEDLNFVPNKELNKEILIPIPRESKIGKDCDFPLGNDFQSFKTFSNPLFEKEDDFPSRNDESILKGEVHTETLKSYLNPLFEKDEEIISNEASSKISPKVDVKTIMSFFAPIGNCVRKWATSEFVKDNVEISHEVFKNDSENSLGIHDDKEEEIAFLDGLLEDENFFEMNDKKDESFEMLTLYVGSDYVFFVGILNLVGYDIPSL
ncbi:reverse transcriptase domain-containing protein [Tanacetum coccineum]